MFVQIGKNDHDDAADGITQLVMLANGATICKDKCITENILGGVQMTKDILKQYRFLSEVIRKDEEKLQHYKDNPPEAYLERCSLPIGSFHIREPW